MKNGKWGFDDFMVVAGFRYCLGRRTYAAGICADWLIEQWPKFSDHTKKIIRRELDGEFRRDELIDCDRASWSRVRGLWS